MQGHPFTRFALSFPERICFFSSEPIYCRDQKQAQSPSAELEWVMRFVARRILSAALALIGGLCFGCPSARALDTAKPLKQYGRQSWQSDTGLPQNTVHSVMQARDGFLWLATDGGLVRFDGQEFRTYTTANTPEIKSDSINDLVEDKAGALWISTAEGLARLDRGKFTLFTTAEGLPSDIVRFVKVRQSGQLLVATTAGLATGDTTGFHALTGLSGDVGAERIAQDADGVVWIASGQQVFRLGPDSTKVSAAFIEPDVGSLQAIAASPPGKNPGEIWIGGKNGLALFREGKRVSLGPTGLAKSSVIAMQASMDGDMWIGTETALLVYSHGLLRQASAPTGRVNKLYADREGSVWAALDLGVIRVSAREPAPPQAPLDLAGVLAISEDREGNMWFGTDVGGVTVLREQAFSTITTQEGLSDDFVRAVFQDHAGTVWLGTNRGGLNRIDQGRISAIQAGKLNGSPGLSSNVVLALAEAGGDLWIGTPDGLSRLHNGQLQLFTTADGLPDDFVRSLYTDTDGSLWIGTRNGLSHYMRGAFTTYSAIDGLGSDLIGSILRTHDGALWVGTLNGLSRFDGKEFKNFTHKDGLGGDAVTAITEDQEGTLWIAAHGAGLTRVRNGMFAALDSSKAGLPTEIYSLMPADPAGGRGPEGSLWLGGARGVFQVSKHDLNEFADGRLQTPRVKSYGVADGMKISECSSGGHPAAWRMKDGSLWFATLKGAAFVQPAEVRENAVAPLAAIEDVLIDDTAASAAVDAVIVPPGRERVTIHFAGLSFAAPQKVRFRYKLEGFDKDWVEAGARRTAYYTNIPHGSYRFLVYASNDDGVWSASPGEADLLVQPRFYQTIWFSLLAGLTLMAAVYLIYRLRVRSVESQYQAVMAERSRIAREIHDTLAQGYVGVSVQLEVASRLLGSTASDGASKAAIQLENTKELVRRSLAEARSSIWNLRSPGSDSETLPARLSAAVQTRLREGSGGTRISFEVQGTFRPIERRVEDEVLRVGQEAIANAVRHASAKAIKVALSYDTSWLKLTVTDDGNGFEQPPEGYVAAGHFGLRGMEERARSIGASLSVTSEHGKGATVELKVDIGRKGKARE